MLARMVKCFFEVCESLVDVLIQLNWHGGAVMRGEGGLTW